MVSDSARLGLDAYAIKHIAVEAIDEEQHKNQQQHKQELKEWITKQMDTSLTAYKQSAKVIKDEVVVKVGHYMTEIKEYMELATKLYHKEIVACGFQQQASFHKVVEEWQQQPHTLAQDPKMPTSEYPNQTLVPEHVDIPRNDNLPGLSCKSIGPPEIPTIPTCINTRSTADVRVQDCWTVQTPQGSTPMQTKHNWRRSYQYQTTDQDTQTAVPTVLEQMTTDHLCHAYPHLVIEEQQQKGPPPDRWRHPHRTSQMPDPKPKYDTPHPQ
jgi:uncharacterized protein YacL (UPF0231 family)